jgi:hypothetical protein
MGAMWQPMSGPRGTTPLARNSAMCQDTIRPQSSQSTHFPVIVCHVLSYGSDTCHRMDMICVTLAVVTHVTSLLVHLYLPCHQSVCPVILPCQLYGPCHVCANCVAMSYVWSYNLYSHLPRGTVRTVQSTFFLPVWKNEQNTISGAYDVHLSLFKLCWVRIDEAYAHVRFEAHSENFYF